MDKNFNVLIVEDEPLIIGVLKQALDSISENNGLMDFEVSSVTNADDATFKIRKAVNTTPYDLVLLDINIPCSTDKKILSGEDLGLQLRSFFPKIKIIVLTNHTDNFRLNNILKSLNPEGFVIKSDIDFGLLLGAIETVIEDIPYYSKRVLHLMRKHIVRDFTLDRLDRQLLYQISKGAKTKDLIEIVHLSKSAIELRKRNLKMIFGLEQGGDRKLIAKAEEHGFI